MVSRTAPVEAVAVTTYPVIALPPSSADAVQVTSEEALSLLTDTRIGATGSVATAVRTTLNSEEMVPDPAVGITVMKAVGPTPTAVTAATDSVQARALGNCRKPTPVAVVTG